MGVFMKIAWRNIWRNMRRSLLIMAAIAFSVAISIFSITIGDGTHDAAIRNALDLHTGYIQIHEKGYQDDPSVEMVFEYSDRIKSAVKSDPRITAAAPRLQTGALIGTSTSSVGGMVVGVDPENEKKLTTLYKKIVKGKYLDGSEPHQCIVGEKMAKNINLKLGSSLVILTQGVDGSTGALRFKVTGFFRSGMDEMDRSMVFISLDDADQLLRAQGMIHILAMNTANPRQVKKVVNKLRIAIPNDKLEILGWRDLVPALVQFINLDDLFNYIFVGLLMLIVTFGVLSALFAAILERTREIGLMLALGTRPHQVIMVILMESLFLTGVGLIIGLIAGLAISYYVAANPINLPAESQAMLEQYGMENKIFAAIYPHRVAVICIVILLLSLTFSIYPAARAASQKPDKALRTME